MKKTTVLIWTLLFLGAFSSSFAQSEKYSRIKIDLANSNIQELAALGLDVDHGIHAKGRFFISDFSQWDIDQLQQSGLPFRVLIEDVSAYYVQRNQQALAEATQRGPDNCDPNSRYPYITPHNFALGSMAGFLTYQEMLDNLDQMAALYPNLISARAPLEGHTTLEGRPIYWLRISDNPNEDEATEPEVFYNAVHHAREPNSMSQLIFFMWYLLENYDSDPEVQFIVDQTALYFVPCVNPDGYIYNEQNNPEGGGLWRKNRRLNADGSYGVDLNRNYGFQWGFDNSGSSGSPNSQVYRGTDPFSEPETQAIRDFCNAHQFKIALNYHTFGNLLVQPWGFSDSNTSEVAVFDALSQALILHNFFLAGTPTETVGYTVNGNSDDWMYGETGTKPAIYSMTPEVGRSDAAGGFWPVITSIENNCKATVWTNLATALAVHNFGIAQENNSRILRQANGLFNYRLQRHGLLEGTLTVGITPLSANVLSVGDPKQYSLSNFEPIEDGINYTLSPNIYDEDEVTFLLWVDNGGLIRTDTIHMFYRSESPAFEDEGVSLSDNWDAASSQWGLSLNDYHSAPSALTDSPQGDYLENLNNTLSLSQTIPVDVDAEAVYLSFWTRWETEPSFDYAQVRLSVNQGPYFPLCGQYTVQGTDYQDPGQPVYEGEQLSWVHEWMDLSPFVSPGDQINLQFAMVADSYGGGEGFLIDDVEVQIFDGEVNTAVSIPPTQAFSQSSYPNPAINEVTIKINYPHPTNNAVVDIIDSMGRLYARKNAENNANGLQARFDTKHWPAGVYYYQLKQDGQIFPSGRLVLIK